MFAQGEVTCGVVTIINFFSKCLYVCGDRRGTRLSLSAWYFFPSEYFDNTIELTPFYFSPSSPLVPVISPFLLRKHHLWFLKAHFVWLFCFSSFFSHEIRGQPTCWSSRCIAVSFGEHARSASSCSSFGVWLLSCSARAPALSHGGEWAF